ncbi:venom allergen 5-like [Drosophila navojoa]|uniref:venom allergen 5-like n=1 Tax=Drosophila navojoa TaxID=7232 RepID=UPI000846BE18|nr:venom allergen 5-like [Drosophila navojoa]
MMNFSLWQLTVILVLGICAGQGNGKANRLLLQNYDQVFDGAQSRSAHGEPNNCLSELWSTECPPDAYLVPMSPQLVEYIVSLHNYLRSTSGAQTKSIPFRWSNELEKLAEYNVKQCKVAHDDCLTNTYKITGQNLAHNVYTGTFNARTDSALVLQSIKSWWGEYKNSQQEKIGFDKNIVIGCAASRFYSKTSHNFLIACNYATINNLGQFELRQDNTAGLGYPFDKRLFY